MGALVESRHVSTVRKIEASDKEAFIHFYNDGVIDRVYTPIADFLAWKKIQVKSEEWQFAFPSKHWTHSYRSIAALDFKEGDPLPYKKSISGILLFDVDFLIVNYQMAKDWTVDRALGQLI